jgi:hypothetical protein
LLNGKTLFVTKEIEGEKERNGKASWSTNDVQNKSWSTDEKTVVTIWKTVVTIWKHPQQQKDYLPPQLRGKKNHGALKPNIQNKQVPSPFFF